MGKRKTKNDFISDAMKIHGDIYDYSLVEYINNKTKVKIICSKHGVFEQRPDMHSINKQGCASCYGNKKKTKEQFIKEAKGIHGDKYDYSLVEYVNVDEKIKIICLEHGVFEQTPYAHIKLKHNCPSCKGNKKKTKEQFIKEAKGIHGDKYDYSLVKYKNTKTKVKIICKEHGVFEQSPTEHIQYSGCPYCYGLYKSTNQFILDAKMVHGDKYDYSLVDYINNKTKVKIFCNKHGIFKQSPNSHLRNSGCPICNESKGEIKIRTFLMEENISFKYQKRFNGCKHINPLPFDFYLPDYNICIEYDGKQHFQPIEIWGGDNELQKQIKKDKIKNDYCKKNDIRLIRIKYTDNIVEKLSLIKKGN